jgi:hypothetical protein
MSDHSDVTALATANLSSSLQCLDGAGPSFSLDVDKPSSVWQADCLAQVQLFLLASTKRASDQKARLVGLVLAAAGASIATSAPAEAAAPAAGVHLSWVRTDSAGQCPDASRLEADVARRLGRSVFGGPARFSIEVTVSKVDATWKADIEMRSAEGDSLGSRAVTSEAATCASLASAASLAMSLLIERYAPPPDRAARLSPAPAAPPAEPLAASSEPALTAKPARVAIAPKPAGSIESFPSGSFAVLGTVASAVLPSTSFGVGIVADVNVSRRFYATIGGNFFPQERLTVSDVDAAFSMTWGSLGGCYRVTSGGPFQLSGCASWLLGAMHSTVLTPVPWQTSQRLWTGGTAGARLAWAPAGPLEIRANLEALVPAERRTYAIERTPPEANTLLFTEPAVSAVASIGVGVRY